MMNEFNGLTVDCSQGLDKGLVNLIQSSMPHLSQLQSSVLNKLGEAQEG